MQKTFIKVVVALVATVILVGFIAPSLISSGSTIGAAIGFAVLLLWTWLILFPFGVARWISNKLKESKGSSSIIAPIGIAFMALGMSACSKVPAGNVGIRVNMLGDSKGVEQEELGVGRYWMTWNQELFVFPTFTQNYVWTASEDEGSPNDESINFQTVEGLEVSGDFGITYHIEPDKVGLLFQTYRRGVEEITDIFLRNIARDELNQIASKLTIEQIYGEGKEQMMLDLNERCKKAVEGKGIVIEKVYVIGKLRLPDTVVTSLNLKIEATQKALQIENEIKGAEAEAKKRVAEAKGQAEAELEIARAKAEANQIIAASITPELIGYLAAEKWNGTLPTFMAGETLPMIQLPVSPPKPTPTASN